MWSGSLSASAWASSSERRTSCMATRPDGELTVVIKPTTSTSPVERTWWSAKALSLPLDQLIHARGTSTRGLVTGRSFVASGDGVTSIARVPDQGKAEPGDHLPELLVGLQPGGVGADLFSPFDRIPKAVHHRRPDLEKTTTSG